VRRICEGRGAYAQGRDIPGFGTLTVAFVIGLQSLITIISRHRAGAMCDFIGPKQAVLTGLPVAAVAALFYLLPEVMPVGAVAALSLLLIGNGSCDVGPRSNGAKELTG
jgi:hypothetical protein